MIVQFSSLTRRMKSQTLHKYEYHIFWAEQESKVINYTSFFMSQSSRPIQTLKIATFSIGRDFDQQMRFSISIVCAPYTETNISESAQFDYYRLLAKQSESKIEKSDLSRNGETWEIDQF